MKIYLLLILTGIQFLSCVNKPKEPGANTKNPKPSSPVSIDSLIDAYFIAVSGNKGSKDWSKLTAICIPSVQLNAMGITEQGKNEFHPTDLRTFTEHFDQYFAANSFFQSYQIKRVDHYAHIAQAWCQYASFADAGKTNRIDRGMIGFQLVELDGRWKIANVIYNSETNEHPLTE